MDDAAMVRVRRGHGERNGGRRGRCAPWRDNASYAPARHKQRETDKQDGGSRARKACLRRGRGGEKSDGGNLVLAPASESTSAHTPTHARYAPTGKRLSPPSAPVSPPPLVANTAFGEREAACICLPSHPATPSRPSQLDCATHRNVKVLCLVSSRLVSSPNAPPSLLTPTITLNMGLKRSRSHSLPSPDLPPTPSSRAHSVEARLVHLHLDTESAVSDQPAVMKCSLPPHGPLAFASFEAYDVHYQQTHMNRCSDCQRNFPDAHFLGLHIAENHDPISAARRDRGEKTVG